MPLHRALLSESVRLLRLSSLAYHAFQSRRRDRAEAGGGCRLKQATVMRQEDEEDSVRWRVEAEVRLAVDRAQQAAAQQEAQMHKDLADLQVR